MFRRCGAVLRRISYVTDVEGDFSYFQRFVCVSRVLRWENTTRSTSSKERWSPLQSADVPLRSSAEPPGSTPVIASSSSAATAPGVSGDTAQPPNVHTDGGARYDATYSHLIDATQHRLTFADATSHFVFGGDAFDHGADLTFGRVLLDFKRRFPDRVHLLLGNRDVNKMVLGPRMAIEVAGLPPDVAENRCFALPRLSKDAVAAAAMTEQLRYKDYLAQRRLSAAHNGSTTEVSDATTEGGRSGTTSDAQSQSSLSRESPALLTDPVTFLQWTLKHKLGSPNAFDHRRQELKELRVLEHRQGNMDVHDADVAASFFAAAQPGGVYYEYLRLGVLSVVLDGVLFVHGGVNGSNAGFVPSLSATTYAEQITAGEWWLPEVAPVPAGSDAAEPSAVDADAAAASAVTTRRRSALEWLAALSAFKDAAFAEWCGGTGLAGEALRSYVYPRVVAPHSIAVGTVMQLDGPHHICLPAAAYLIESGIHTVCGGHQPIGDTPAVVRQPGGFLIIDADTSYCGRGNAFCTAYNRRGAAVMELLFDSGDDEAAAAGLTAHGRRADGAPFDFVVSEDMRVGRYVGDGWWVRLPPSAAAPDGPHGGCYELRRTRDGFRQEEVRWATPDEVDAQLQWALACKQSVSDGSIAPKYTKAELAEVHVHRIKTKVTRAPPPSA